VVIHVFDLADGFLSISFGAGASLIPLASEQKVCRHFEFWFSSCYGFVLLIDSDCFSVVVIAGVLFLRSVFFSVVVDCGFPSMCFGRPGILDFFPSFHVLLLFLIVLCCCDCRLTSFGVGIDRRLFLTSSYVGAF
jgi:hypothetical protein